MRSLVWVVLFALLVVAPGAAADGETSTSSSGSESPLAPTSGSFSSGTTGPEPTGCRPYCD